MHAELTDREQNQTLPSISVFGLGKLGACMAATFAQAGFDVLGIDVNPKVVSDINAGLAPVSEPQLQEVIEAGLGRLSATQDAAAGAETDVSFFIVPTPSLPDGSFSNELLMRAMAPLARAVRESGKPGHTFVVSSTLTPGASRDVIIPMLEKEIAGRVGIDFGFAYNPEFIALGDVIQGLLSPDMVLIGESDRGTGDLLESIYRRYNTNQPHLTRMSVTSAELAKISVNSYITTKISFTNQLRMIAEAYEDTDIHAILGAVGADSRIGHKYLRAGLSYGGPCFPRDNRLLGFAARRAGVSAPLAEASDRVNEITKEKLAEQALAATRPRDTVAVLGMAYRPNTYIVEESAGLHVAQYLKRHERRVVVHDFASNSINSPSLLEFDELEELSGLGKLPALAALVICSPWDGYRAVEVPDGAVVFDPWGVLNE
jgi:UDPglucose 6-dehydrogenase